MNFWQHVTNFGINNWARLYYGCGVVARLSCEAEQREQTVLQRIDAALIAENPDAKQWPLARPYLRSESDTELALAFLLPSLMLGGNQAESELRRVYEPNQVKIVKFPHVLCRPAPQFADATWIWQLDINETYRK